MMSLRLRVVKRRILTQVGTSQLALHFAEHPLLVARRRRVRREKMGMVQFPPDYEYPQFPAWERYNIFDAWPEFYTQYGERYFRVLMTRNDWLRKRFLVSLQEWQEEHPYRGGPLTDSTPSTWDWVTLQQHWYHTV